MLSWPPTTLDAISSVEVEGDQDSGYNLCTLCHNVIIILQPSPIKIAGFPQPIRPRDFIFVIGSSKKLKTDWSRHRTHMYTEAEILLNVYQTSLAINSKDANG